MSSVTSKARDFSEPGSMHMHSKAGTCAFPEQSTGCGAERGAGRRCTGQAGAVLRQGLKIAGAGAGAGFLSGLPVRVLDEHGPRVYALDDDAAAFAGVSPPQAPDEGGKGLEMMPPLRVGAVWGIVGAAAAEKDSR